MNEVDSCTSLVRQGNFKNKVKHKKFSKKCCITKEQFLVDLLAIITLLFCVLIDSE